MSEVKFHKFVGELPEVLEADAIYFVRVGGGFDLYITNSDGAITSYAINKLTLEDVTAEIGQQIEGRYTTNESVTGTWSFNAGIDVGPLNMQDFVLQCSTTAPNQVVASFPTAGFRSAKFQIQAGSGEHTQMTEVGLVHDGAQTFMVEYASIHNGTSVASFSTDVLNGICRLLCTPEFPNTTVRALRVVMAT